MVLPPELDAILSEIASMSSSDEYNLRVAGNIALRLRENFHRLIPNSIQNQLDNIRHYLGLYKNVDERLRFLYDKMGEWYLRYRPGPRYTENPIYPSRKPSLMSALAMIRDICVGRQDANLAKAGLHAAEAMSTMGKAGFDQYTGAALLLVSTKLHEAWAAFQMPKAMVGPLKTIDRYLSDGYRSRYTLNPIMMSEPKYGGPYFISDDLIRVTATNQGFTRDERECIVTKTGNPNFFYETYSPFEYKGVINGIGRGCIRTYGHPRNPKSGDRLWHMGIIDRKKSPRITATSHEGQKVVAEDGHIYDYKTLLAIESPWPPYTPLPGKAILWWDTSR